VKAELATEEENSSDGGSGASTFGDAEYRRPRRRQPSRELVEAAGSALLVGLSERAGTPLGHERSKVLCSLGELEDVAVAHLVDQRLSTYELHQLHVQSGLTAPPAGKTSEDLCGKRALLLHRPGDHPFPVALDPRARPLLVGRVLARGRTPGRLAAAMTASRRRTDEAITLR
jgi:hypothetical protein